MRKNRLLSPAESLPVKSSTPGGEGGRVDEQTIVSVDQQFAGLGLIVPWNDGEVNDNKKEYQEKYYKGSGSAMF